MPGSAGHIPRSNVTFVREYLAREGMHVVAISVGGGQPLAGTPHVTTLAKGRALIAGGLVQFKDEGMRRVLLE